MLEKQTPSIFSSLPNDLIFKILGLKFQRELYPITNGDKYHRDPSIFSQLPIDIIKIIMNIANKWNWENSMRVYNIWEQYHRDKNHYKWNVIPRIEYNGYKRWKKKMIEAREGDEDGDDKSNFWS